jgi:hypothetical protein
LTDRTYAIQRSLDNFFANPFGNGLYSSADENDAITFIAQLQ